MNPGWDLAYLGDAAVLVRPRVDAALDANAVVHRLAARLRRACIPGVRDVVPGMRDLVVHIQPLRCDIDAIARGLGDDFDDVVGCVGFCFHVDLGGRRGASRHDVELAVHVLEPRTLSASDEPGRTAHTAEGAHRAVHAAGDHRLSPFEQRVGARFHSESHRAASLA